MEVPSRRGSSATAGLLVVSWLGLLGVVIGVGLLLTHPLAGSVGTRENDLARWFEDRRTTQLTDLADVLTTPGNTPVALVGAAVLAVLVGLLGHSWRQALYVVLGVGGVYGIYLVAFSVVPRDRPPVKISRLHLGAHHLSNTVTSLLFAAAWLSALTRVLRPTVRAGR